MKNKVLGIELDLNLFELKDDALDEEIRYDRARKNVMNLSEIYDRFEESDQKVLITAKQVKENVNMADMLVAIKIELNQNIDKLIEKYEEKYKDNV